VACTEEACCPFLNLSNGEVKASLCRSPLTRALVTVKMETANAPPKSLRWRLQRTRNNGRLPSPVITGHEMLPQHLFASSFKSQVFRESNMGSSVPRCILSIVTIPCCQMVG